MANSLSAKKRIRQNIKRRSRNRWRKGQVKAAVKAFSDALHDGQKDKAAEQLKLVYKTLDQVAAKGAIHKNSAARTKARLTRRLAKTTTA